MPSMKKCKPYLKKSWKCSQWGLLVANKSPAASYSDGPFWGQERPARLAAAAAATHRWLDVEHFPSEIITAEVAKMKPINTRDVMDIISNARCLSI